MTRYDQEWVDALVDAGGTIEGLAEPLRLLFVVTDTADGKTAFFLDIDPDAGVTGSAGRLPRGVKADLTVTAKEAVLHRLWAGERSYDAAFMSGDLKVEGGYNVWLDELTPAFAVAPWFAAWRAAV